MLLPYILRFRLDFAAFAVLAVIASWWCTRLIRRRRALEPLPPVIGVALAVFVIGGGLAAEWSGEQRRARLVSVFAAFGPTYAYELQRLGHANVTSDTPPDDSTYLALIDAQRNWLRVNPLISDIYTFRYDPEGRIRMIVDSETDYDHNGRIEGEREERTRIGEVYAEATDDFHATLRGEPRFDTTLVPDRWGLWVSSLTPICDDRGRVEAGVGLDYSAETWLHMILTSRAMALAIAAALTGILLTSATTGVLMRAEIHDRKQAQEQLRRDKDAVDLVSRAKTEFIGVMTHEIRSPLTALMGYASLLLETPLTSLQHRYAQTIANAGDRLVAMLNDILDLTKLEAGRLTVASAPYSPAAVMHELADAVTARAMEKGLVLHFESTVPGGLQVLGDAMRLRQAVGNLLSNAIKFTDAGTVTVRAHWAAADGDRGTLTIDVADTGPGISAERLARVFDLYAAPGPGETDRRGNTGLAVSRQLIDLMGGRIDASSSAGTGSCFSVTLPAALAVETPRPAASAGVERPATLSEPPVVLLVNPQPLGREIVKSVLTRNGYRVEVAGTANEAVDLLRQSVCAAVLVDVEDSSLELTAMASAIRGATSRDKRVPIIAVTAHVRDRRDRYLAAGVDECLTKPMYMPAVLATLRAFVHPGAAAPARDELHLG